MNWRKTPINARHHPLMAGILRHFGKAGYCAYHWMLDLYAIHFNCAGKDMPLVMDHKTLKRELDIRLWGDFWAFLRFVNDWPAVEPACPASKTIDTAWRPDGHQGETAWQLSRNQIGTKSGFVDDNLNSEPSSLLPKWIFWKDDENAYIYIPNYLKTADDWTRRKVRHNGGQSTDNTGVGGSELAPALRRALRHDQRRQEKKNKKHGLAPLFSNNKPQGPPNVLASFLATACNEIDRMGTRTGPPFNPWWFIKTSLHKGHHPKAIRKGLDLAKARWSMTGDLEGMVKNTVNQISEQFGAAFDNQEIIDALMPTFRKMLIPKVAGQDEIEA